MIDQLPLLTVAVLCLVAFAAGWIDSVVGGGGIIQLPALLIGLPYDTSVATVSGTNKLSSVAGTAMAAGTYLAKVRIAWPTTLAAVVTAFAGSTLGAHLVRYVSRAVFTPLTVAVVAVIGLYTWRRPALGQTTDLRHSRTARLLLAAGLGAVVGLWDGLVGPGTGVFFAIGFVALLGHNFLEATTMTKLANLTTNVAALIVLGGSGHVLWGLGACMAVSNLTGGALGARMAIRFGNQFIRMVFLVCVCLVEAKLVYDMVTAYF